jgi:DNA-binding LacI/PurR family transcriptional regulator
MATIREIATRAGFSKSTVSLALREHPHIPVATRRRVQAVARALGYRPNAAFRRLMTEVRAAKPVSCRATLGILHGFAEPQPARSIPYHAEWVAGARERAEAVGYTVDELWMKEPGMTARRLSEIVRARGIDALLIAPLPERRGLQLDWADFTAVTAGFSLIEPRLSRVVPNHQQAMLVCLQQLAQRGYRRIGLAMDGGLDPLARFNLQAPFLWFQAQLTRRPRTGVERVFDVSSDGQAGALRRWLRQRRLDALIATNRRHVDWVLEGRIAVPESLGVVCTSSTVAPPGFCCVDQQPRKLGAAAVDLAIAQLNRGERGVPPNPKTVFTDVTWSDGGSLRQVGLALTEVQWDFF